jgi:CheY-like chemotaxis protein
MHVWFIDDDDITNMLNQYFIEEHFPDISISIFAEAEDALVELCQNKATPDFIFLDINMPVMNGWDFLDELSKCSQARTVFPSVYILSSSVDPSDLQKAEESLFVRGFISKPLEPEKVPFLRS